MYTQKKPSEQGTKLNKISLEKYEINVKRKKKQQTDFFTSIFESSDYLDEIRNKFGNKISKSEIAALGTTFLERLYPQSFYTHVKVNQQDADVQLMYLMPKMAKQRNSP